MDSQLSEQYADKMMEALDSKLHTKEYLLALTYLMHTAMVTAGIDEELREVVLDIGRHIYSMEAVDEL